MKSSGPLPGAPQAQRHVAAAAEADPLIAICGGGGVNLFNSQGDPWTAAYLQVTGELDVDLRSNIAAEARAKIVYERLINFTDDAGSKDALQFLMTREITHMKAFAAALESMGKDPFTIGQIPPTPGIVTSFSMIRRMTATPGRTCAAPGMRVGHGSSSKHRLSANFEIRPDQDNVGRRHTPILTTIEEPHETADHRETARRSAQGHPQRRSSAGQAVG